MNMFFLNVWINNQNNEPIKADMVSDICGTAFYMATAADHGIKFEQAVQIIYNHWWDLMFTDTDACLQFMKAENVLKFVVERKIKISYTGEEFITESKQAC